MAGFIEQVDTQLELLFSGWNLWSTSLALTTVFLVVYPLFFSVDPDTHPFLLSRQAHAAPVRQPGESAVYRSIETPHGFPLRSGLNVKEPGTSKWSAGRDGDLRDIWRRAVSGALNEEGQPVGNKGKIFTVYGTENIEEHDLNEISCQINVLGSHIKKIGAKSVAIYLPNSVETLISTFAAAFYGFSPVFIPYGQPHEKALKLLQTAGVDYLIAAAGSLPLTDLKKQVPAIREVMWVVEKTSRQIDWSEPSQGALTLHDLVDDERGIASGALPDAMFEGAPPDLVFLWLRDTASSGERVSFTQRNVVAAVGAQITALPSRHRVTPEDLILPADSLSNSYVLVHVLAALYVNASLALNSVAGNNADLAIITSGIAPTIVIASSESLLKLHKKMKASAAAKLKSMALRTQIQALDSGYMPPKTVTSNLNPPVRAKLGKLPDKLRLIYVFEKLHAGTSPLNSKELSDLRAFTGARIIYALSAAKVAGAVTQTGFYDYRRFDEPSGKHGHFGVPVSAVEIKVVDTKHHKTEEGKEPCGEIFVSGPAVLNGSTLLGQSGVLKADGTLAFV